MGKLHHHNKNPTVLTPSMIGEMKFALRQIRTKKQREFDKQHDVSPTKASIGERIERIDACMSWLRQQERQLEEV